uniref:Uncharacterized protein n=1 Tax=Pararge aegeria TaxID=116150 RepID=S4NW03_9NEOP
MKDRTPFVLSLAAICEIEENWSINPVNAYTRKQLINWLIEFPGLRIVRKLTEFYDLFCLISRLNYYLVCGDPAN